MNEIWKSIMGYEGYYSISSFGNVRNDITGKLIVGDINNAGYRRVTLYVPIKKRFFVHRLVALHFCNGYSDELIVNHINGIKTDNRCENLEWVTHSENDIHAYANGLRHANIRKPMYKIVQYDLFTGQVLNIFRDIHEAAAMTESLPGNIRGCCTGDQYSSKGYGYMYYLDNDDVDKS